MKRGLEENGGDATKRVRTEDGDAPIRSIYVGHLAPYTTCTHLLDLVNCGGIDKCHIMPGKPFGFITFLEASAAEAFMAEATAEPKQIMNKQIQIGWGTGKALPEDIATAVAAGATRNIFIGNIDASLSEPVLRNSLARFGTVDCVDVIINKRIAFVHFSSVGAAVKCKEVLSQDPQWGRHRFSYGPDRCAPGGKGKKYASDRGPAPQMGGGFGPPGFGGPPAGFGGPAGFGAGASGPARGGPGAGPGAGAGLRTIWLGGVTEQTTFHDICNAVRGGVLDEVRLLPEKKCGFVSFVSPQSAQMFMSMFKQTGLPTEGGNLKVGWGKPRALPRDIALAVEQGATRNLFLGNIDNTVSQERLRNDLAKFGEIEKCDVLLEKKIAFVNFTSIRSARECVTELNTQGSELSSQGYGNFRIHFGKDRCARTGPSRRGPPSGGSPQFNNAAASFNVNPYNNAAANPYANDAFNTQGGYQQQQQQPQGYQQQPQGYQQQPQGYQQQPQGYQQQQALYQAVTAAPGAEAPTPGFF